MNKQKVDILYFFYFMNSNFTYPLHLMLIGEFVYLYLKRKTQFIFIIIIFASNKSHYYYWTLHIVVQIINNIKVCFKICLTIVKKTLIFLDFNWKYDLKK